jgi:Leucine-rich repeat (LRR) protein
MSYLKKLKILILSKNKIGELPQNIGNLESFEILNLKEQPLSKKLLESFYKLPGLKTLILTFPERPPFTDEVRKQFPNIEIPNY